MSIVQPEDFRRLLLVDDEPGIRRMMSLDLGTDGYQVFTAEDGVRGLEIFEQERPELVLTDLKMPGMDGIELLERIKAASPDTEVIVITGHGDMELAIESLQLDAADFITKPINPRALAVALRRARERLAMKAELASYTQDLERKAAEAAAKVVAAERLAAVGQTVAALVHSIKNMLSGLKGGTYLVKTGREKDDTAMIKSGVEMLDRNIRRVESLVRDLLTISKPRQPRLKPVDAAGLASEAIECMTPAALEKGVVLELEEPAPAGVVLRVEDQAILDCLQNLISNALDAACEGKGGKVSLGLRADRREAVFWVRDNGPGLDAEDRERIFQGFYSTKGAEGAGLGLMVTDKNAREHGGRVDYRNLPGGGAEFSLTLPRRMEAAPEGPAEKS